MKKAIAVFLDRDGTVCEEVGHMDHPDRLVVYPWSAEAIRLINGAGMKAIVVTNQSGVARGYFGEEMVTQINEKMQEALEAQGARLDAIYYCPHHADVGQPPYRLDCHCRKPKPGMLLKAADEFDIDLTRSFVVGDRYVEIKLAKDVGATSVFVLTGYGRGEYESRRATWPVQPDHVAENLLDAVTWILNGKQTA